MAYYVKGTIDDNCYYELILGILIYLQRERIHAETVDGEKWAEVDDPNDLWMADYVFGEGKKLELLQKSFGGYWNHDILDFLFYPEYVFPEPFHAGRVTGQSAAVDLELWVKTGYFGPKVGLSAFMHEGPFNGA